MSNKITIIIPAYNEEKGIGNTIKQVFADVPDSVVLVIDDASNDGTLNKIMQLKNRYANLKVIRHAKNRGYGGALKTGFKNAKTKYISFIDADMTYKPKYILLLMSELKEKNLDCIWSNRFGGKNDMPFIRKIGNKMLVLLFFAATFRYVPDVTSGERLFRVESLRKIDPDTLPNGLDMISAMSKRIISRKLNYSTIDCDYLKRDGKSKLNIVTDFLKMSKNIIFEK